MKQLSEMDLEAARLKLTDVCHDFIKENKGYWSNHSLIGKSPNKIVKDFIKELNAQESTAKLICKVGEYKSDSSLVNKLQTLVVTELYQTPDKVINQLGVSIARENLVVASRGFSLGVTTNPAPDIGAAIHQLFLDYWKTAKSVAPLASLEL